MMLVLTTEDKVMTKQDIFKTLIDILRPSKTRCAMEFDIPYAERVIFPQVKAAGLTLLGMGMYSVVVEHKNYHGRAFKVTTSRWDGFRAYAKYCIENAGTKFLPVIYSANEQGNFGWYEMDKYYPIIKQKNNYDDFVSTKIGDLYSYAHAGQYATSVNDMRGNSEEIAIATVAANIMKEFHGRFVPDIHSSNVMMDKDGNVFITDPLSCDVRREIPVTEEDPVFY